MPVRHEVTDELIEWNISSGWAAVHNVDLEMFGSIAPRCVICDHNVTDIHVLFFRSEVIEKKGGVIAQYGQDMLFNVPCCHFVVQNPQSSLGDW